MIFSMKKFVFFFILLLFASFANAQKLSLKNFSVGVNAGTTYSKINSYPKEGVDEPYIPDNTQKFSIGNYFGANIYYAVTPKWKITTGVNYVENKIKYSLGDVQFWNEGVDSMQLGAYANMVNSTNFLSIPLAISYSLLSQKNTPFILIGAAANFYLGTHERYKVYDDNKKKISSGELKERKSEYNIWNVPIAFGGGYRYNISEKYDLCVQAIYCVSTKSLLKKNPNRNVNHEIKYVQLALCFIYNLNQHK